MKSRLKALSLAVMLILAPMSPVLRAQGPTEQSDQTIKIKSEVARRINKEKTRVKIRLRDGAEMKARITQAGENSFTVTDEKTGKETELAFSDVSKIKGRGMSTGLKIGIFAGVVVATVAIIGVLAVKSIDPFEGPILR